MSTAHINTIKTTSPRFANMEALLGDVSFHPLVLGGHHTKFAASVSSTQITVSKSTSYGWRVSCFGVVDMKLGQTKISKYE